MPEGRSAHRERFGLGHKEAERRSVCRKGERQHAAAGSSRGRQTQAGSSRGRQKRHTHDQFHEQTHDQFHDQSHDHPHEQEHDHAAAQGRGCGGRAVYLWERVRERKEGTDGDGSGGSRREADERGTGSGTGGEGNAGTAGREGERTRRPARTSESGIHLPKAEESGEKGLTGGEKGSIMGTYVRIIRARKANRGEKGCERARERHARGGADAA